VRSGKGVFIEDRDGNRLLDAFAGLYCVNVGYGRTEIAEAIAAQAHELAYYHAYAGHGTEPAIRLARMVLDRAPEHMSKVYFGLSGSDANETNIKLVWYYNNILGRPEKKKIVSRLARLSRLGADDRIADRAGALPQEVRPAAVAGAPYRGAVLFPPPRRPR
jgi:L-2,4-diaminobutyrate transaminase